MTRPAPWTQTAAEKRRRSQDSAKVKVRRVRAVSKRHDAARREYLKAARTFIDTLNKNGRTCPVVASITELQGKGISNRITEVHHVFGRAGALYLWTPGWRGLSTAGHEWVHKHPILARKYGWLAPLSLWNNPRKVIGVAQALTTNEEVMQRFLTVNGYAR